ncbi:MAG: hypothetical protein JST43_04885 [Bacteroidetes bacterium]|nr:hypothetical protein [Bacteroidota bacterium]MBS1539840.1 hypothetical protein [Bacteroidota bacterium]
MERDQFSYLLANFTALTTDEAALVINLANDFPYSQAIHGLAARASQDAAIPLHESILHLSAIYSTDRAALKAVMTQPKQKRVEPEPEYHEAISKNETSDLPLHLQLLKDLEAMHEAKRIFEATVEQLELNKAIPLTENKTVEVAPPAIPTTTGNDLIEEIKSTKKKIKPGGEKQKEQSEIIDQFIKIQPTISRPQPTAKQEKDLDLAEPSSQFGENIVSETLVEILLKQGKKEKAIEALKKLIWKFPQKKAYFAAQIEDLRK